MCSPLSVLHPQCVPSLPIRPPLSPWFPQLCSAAVSEMRGTAEQEARALCGDSASQSDKIAVIFFLQNQHSVCVPPLYLHLHPWHFCFYWCCIAFSFWISQGVKCQMKEWDPMYSFSPSAILSPFQKMIRSVFQMQSKVSNCASSVAVKAASSSTIMGLQVKGSQINWGRKLKYYRRECKQTGWLPLCSPAHSHIPPHPCSDLS